MIEVISKEIFIQPSTYLKKVSQKQICRFLNPLKQKFQPIHFKPKLLPTFITLLFFVLFVYLGFWQLQRMAYKKSLEEQSKQQSQNYVIKLPDSSSQNSVQSPSLQHSPPPRRYLSSYRHLGYALQWFVFATILLIYYGILSCEKKSQKLDQAPESKAEKN
jgi:cytochrome oxidase assembly protein ShyY1